MRKILFITLSLLLVAGITFAQKGNDGGGKKTNNDKKNNNDGGGSSCGNLGSTTALFGSYQKNMMSKSSSTPNIMSIEAMLLGGYGMISNDYGSTNVYNLMPRAKINFGILSGDVRFNYWMLTDTSLANVAQNVDALIEFNLAPIRGMKIFIGLGVMYDMLQTENNMYYEALLGADISLMGTKFYVTPELRYVHDFANSSMIYFEGGAKASYRLLSVKPIQLYANLGLNYQAYSESGVFTPYLGVSVLLH